MKRSVPKLASIALDCALACAVLGCALALASCSAPQPTTSLMESHLDASGATTVTTTMQDLLGLKHADAEFLLACPSGTDDTHGLVLRNTNDGSGERSFAVDSHLIWLCEPGVTESWLPVSTELTFTKHGRWELGAGD